jgi:hypothetical protein
MMPPNLPARLCLLLLLALAASSPGLAADDPGEALRSAASAGDLAKVRELLDAGADVNSANSYGGTALAFACDHGHTAVVDLLLSRGANVNAADRYYGATPLSWAVNRGHAAIVRSLLEKGAQGEAQAMLSAARDGQASVVAVVLERGKLGPEVLGEALAAAMHAEQTEVVALLQAAGAKPPPVVTVDPAVLAGYEGSYAGTFRDEPLEVLVTTKDGKVIVTTDRWAFTFVATDAVTFRAEDVPGLEVAFTVEAGKATGLTLEQGDSVTPLARKETP